MPRRNYSKKRQTTPYVAPTPDVACREKRRFPTEKQAIYAAETQELQHPEIELRTYECQFCGDWHLTRSKK